MSQHQHPLWPEPHWTDSFAEGDHLTNKYTGNEGVVRLVKAGRYLLVRWTRGPVPHTCRHYLPLGLLKADAA